ncbi:unnamed protein product [Pylaiella littoralis]
MFGTSNGAVGNDAGYGYQARSRGRGRYEAQEEQLVEGDLFGSTHRSSFLSADPPVGRPPRAAYYDGTTRASAGVGENIFMSGAGGGIGIGVGGAGGYNQTPAAQPSPFQRGPASANAFVSGSGSGSGLGPGYGSSSARYSSQVGAAAAGGQPQQAFSSSGGSFSSAVALVPVEADGGAGRGRNVMDDDDDDDDMPTRSLVDDPDSRDDGATAAAEAAAAAAAEGLRHRRARRGDGSRTDHGGGGSAGVLVGGVNVEPDAQRATWVVVWGVPPEMAREVLTRFLRFGHVEEQRGQSGSNWIYLKYATRLQAEKARAAGHGSRLTETVMLGVEKLSDDEAWHALREGRIPPLEAANPVLAKGAAGKNAKGCDAMEIDDADLLGAPPQRPRGDMSVCRRILAAFGFH